MATSPASPPISSQAATLAAEGYFVDAFGSNVRDGYMLIGMRVLGNSLPRAITNGLTPSDSAYLTVVVRLAEPSRTEMIEEQ